MTNKPKILLVDDNKPFGESLKTLLVKSGYDCFYASKPQEALAYMKVHHVDGAVIDCMLPQMNGIDLAVEIREMTGNNLPIFFMSGIYKDKTFSVNALKKTKAKAFLIKPFDHEDLISQFKEHIGDNKQEVTLTENLLKNLLLQENISQQDIINAITNTKMINALELPFILNTLSTYKATATLSIKAEGESCALYFENGNVFIENKDVKFPAINKFLKDNGYVVPEDIEQVGPDGHLELLVGNNIVSPHFVELAEKQLSLHQLGTIIKNQSVNIELCTAKTESPLLKLSGYELDDYAYRLINNQTDLAWLKTYYLPYVDNTIKSLDTSHKKVRAFPLIAAHKNIVDSFLSGKTINDIVSVNLASEDIVYKVFHTLAIYREIIIHKRKSSSSTDAHVHRLKKLITSMDQQNYFERLGLTLKATDQDIKKAYSELSQTLHPDKIDTDSDEILALSKDVYGLIQEAYSQLKTTDLRNTYLEKVKFEESKLSAASDLQLNQALTLLYQGDISGAQKQIDQAKVASGDSPKLKVLQAWCWLKNKQKNALFINRYLQDIPLQQKTSSSFLHVRGLIYVAQNEPAKAIIAFKNALSAEPNFISARRELTALEQGKGKSGAKINIFKADLKDVVGLFFKKK